MKIHPLLERDADEPVYTIGVVSRLTGLSPRQLRWLDVLGIVVPARTEGGRRMYSEQGLQRARVAAWLMRERHVGLPGIREILRLCEKLGYEVVIDALEIPQPLERKDNADESEFGGT
jgi:MerR family transcriptional regulator/heat shock protein HspR